MLLCVWVCVCVWRFLNVRVQNIFPTKGTFQQYWYFGTKFYYKSIVIIPK